ncbi:MAG: polysaccharide biosynthesis/export family protein [Pseudomonadota bacterium]
MKKAIVPFLLCGALAACAGNPPLRQDLAVAKLQVVDSDKLPPPERKDLFENNRPYLIGPFDKLIIDVFGIEELSKKEVQTDAGGRISFPLAGIVEAAGHTPGELEAIISERLSGRFIRDPQVTVNLKETVSQVITVDGQVKEPGLYPVIGRMTLMRAVATAKGAGEFAKLSDVVIFRTVGGQKMAALYDLKSIRRGYYEDPEVFANDVIVVGDDQARRIFRDVLSVAPLLTAPLVVLLQ